MFGSRFPAPRATQLTRWEQDRHALGSYSFNAVGTSPATRRALAGADWDGQIWFAGEAASTEFFGTAHGALRRGGRLRAMRWQVNDVLVSRGRALKAGCSVSRTSSRLPLHSTPLHSMWMDLRSLVFGGSTGKCRGAIHPGKQIRIAPARGVAVVCGRWGPRQVGRLQPAAHAR